jgi:hypothetical protein
MKFAYKLRRSSDIHSLVGNSVTCHCKCLDNQTYFRLTAHHPFLGDNDGHPVGLSLFENDIAVFKFDNAEDMKCRKKKVWPACLPSKVGMEKCKIMNLTKCCC